MIRIILFEDKAENRKSISRIFEGSDKIFLTSMFENAQNAVKEVKKLEPDVILMDIQMPGINGLDALLAIKEKFPLSKVLIVTSFAEDDKIFAAICNGASGYVLKDDIDGLESGVVEVFNGGAHMTPSIALKVMRMLQNNIVVTQKTYTPLTKRELDVLKQMVEGNSRKEIGNILYIGVDAVGDHIKNIYKKLHVNSAAAAVREAIVKKII